jgi:YD repeat-containing protein
MKMKKTLILISIVLLVAVGTQAEAGTVSYNYDGVGRLIQVTYPNFTRITFSYDPAGNLLSRTVELRPPGDVSGSYKVEMADAILLLQYAAELIQLSDDQQKEFAYITGHENPDDVGLADAVKIMSLMAGSE